MHYLRSTLRRTFSRHRSIDWFGLSLVVLLILGLWGVANVHSEPRVPPSSERSVR